MNEPLIRDIPNIRKMLEDINSLALLKRSWPHVRPLLEMFGIDADGIDRELLKVDELARQAEALARMPDRFNDLFAPRGWIIYDMMKAEVAEAAIVKAEAGDLEGAEHDLVEYYNVETVRWNLTMMNAVAAFRPRMRLAQKALTDYEAERYHACIPVVLALLDGLVNVLHAKQRGFFAEDIDLTAWNSIAAHSRGLNVLAGIFQKGRRKTTTEQITIPYRHGIMHGMDLGYDNRVVAAKTWGALFATRDWALKAERGLLEASPKEPDETWTEILEQFRGIETDKKALELWKPRNVVAGSDIPATGSPALFSEGSPERKLAEFLSFWKSANYGYMAQCLSTRFGPPAKNAPAVVRERYESKSLKSFTFTELSDIAAGVSEIQVELEFEEYEREVKKSVRFRLIYEDIDGNPAVREKLGGKWIIINWQIY